MSPRSSSAPKPKGECWPVFTPPETVCATTDAGTETCRQQQAQYHEDITTSAISPEKPIESNQPLDTITGLPNRRAMVDMCHSLFAKKIPFTFTMLDLRRLKEMNDYSYNLGNDMLGTVGMRLRALCEDETIVDPNTTFAFRSGGDEFVVISHSKASSNLPEWDSTVRNRISGDILHPENDQPWTKEEIKHLIRKKNPNSQTRYPHGSDAPRFKHEIPTSIVPVVGSISWTPVHEEGEPTRAGDVSELVGQAERTMGADKDRLLLSEVENMALGKLALLVCAYRAVRESGVQPREFANLTAILPDVAQGLDRDPSLDSPMEELFRETYGRMAKLINDQVDPVPGSAPGLATVPRVSPEFLEDPYGYLAYVAGLRTQPSGKSQ